MQTGHSRIAEQPLGLVLFCTERKNGQTESRKLLGKLFYVKIDILFRRLTANIKTGMADIFAVTGQIQTTSKQNKNNKKDVELVHPS